jgi:hypothetical protein
LNLLNQIPRQLSALRDLINDFGEVIPFSLYPEREGLLPVGLTDNGDVLYWLMRGEPDQWSVVLNESRGPKYETFAGSLSSFLTESLTGRVKFKIFPDNAFKQKARFETL